MSLLERRIFWGLLALAALAGVAMQSVSRGTGVAALTLLCASLALSPVASVVPAAGAVACRAARRKLGIASALFATIHACWALPRYLDPLVLEPIARVPWLRQGAIALAILVVLALTSFAPIQRALRVRAWSSLHRLVYVAGLLASIHAIAVPFGSVRVGIAALALTALFLLVRPLTAVLGRRSASPGRD
jgi:sulfoxide reductase heme-binding subunit YedZ